MMRQIFIDTYLRLFIRRVRQLKFKLLCLEVNFNLWRFYELVLHFAFRNGRRHNFTPGFKTVPRLLRTI